MPTLAQCRITGARHLREGKPCQDAVRGVVLGNLVALAVADGHGTSPLGDVGAALAVDVAVEHLLRFAVELGPNRSADLQAVQAYAEHPLRVQLVRDWGMRARRHGGTEATDLKPYGSTLLFALSSPAFLLLGQIGDGDMLLVDSTRLVSRPIAVDPSNFAEETTSLCQNEAWMAIRLSIHPAPTSHALLILSTDGYSKSYATDQIFEMIGPDYLDMFDEYGAESLERKLREILEAVSQGGSGDDIALGMMHWPGATAAVKPGSRSMTNDSTPSAEKGVGTDGMTPPGNRD